MIEPFSKTKKRCGATPTCFLPNATIFWDLGMVSDLGTVQMALGKNRYTINNWLVVTGT